MSLISYNLAKIRSRQYVFAYHLAMHLQADGNRFEYHGTNRNEVVTALGRYVNSRHGLLSYEPEEADSRLRAILACGYTCDELGLTPERHAAIKLCAAMADQAALGGSLDDCVEAFRQLASLVERVVQGYAIFDEGTQMKTALVRRYTHVMRAVFWEAGRTSGFEFLCIINTETQSDAPDKLPVSLVGPMTADRSGFPPDLYQKIVSQAHLACEMEAIVDGNDAA